MKKSLMFAVIFIIWAIAFILFWPKDLDYLASVMSLPTKTTPLQETVPVNPWEDISNKKIYNNETYGIQFFYPGNLTLEEKTNGLGSETELACPNLLRIILTNPDLPTVQYTAGGPATKPSIVINIRKKSCYPSTSTGFIDGLSVAAVLAGLQSTLDLHQNIWPALMQKWFTENMSKTIAVAIPSYGVSSGSATVWLDSCAVGSVQQVNSTTYIKNTNCVLDNGLIAISGGTPQTFYQTNVLIPQKSNATFIDIKAGRDFYDNANNNSINIIINSLKPSQGSLLPKDQIKINTENRLKEMP